MAELSPEIIAALGRDLARCDEDRRTIAAATGRDEADSEWSAVIRLDRFRLALAALERIPELERENARLIGEYDENIRMAQRAEAALRTYGYHLGSCMLREGGRAAWESAGRPTPCPCTCGFDAARSAAAGDVAPAEPPSLEEVAAAIVENYGSAIRKLDAPAEEGCPFCDPSHPDPARRPWAAWVGSVRDGDGQPTQIIVAPTEGGHVSESDAEWLRRLMRAAAPAPEEVKPCPTCDGCGQVADTESREPWTAWANLPPGSDAAVRMGLVKPIPCPVCAAPAEEGDGG